LIKQKSDLRQLAEGAVAEEPESSTPLTGRGRRPGRLLRRTANPRSGKDGLPFFFDAPAADRRPSSASELAAPAAWPAAGLVSLFAFAKFLEWARACLIPGRKKVRGGDTAKTKVILLARRNKRQGVGRGCYSAGAGGREQRPGASVRFNGHQTRRQCRFYPYSDSLCMTPSRCRPSMPLAGLEKTWENRGKLPWTTRLPTTLL